MKKRNIDCDDSLYAGWIELEYRVENSLEEINLFTTTPNYDMNGAECELFNIESIEKLAIEGIGEITPSKTYKFNDSGCYKVYVKFKDMTIIPFSAFVGCTNLESVYIPDSIKLIEGFAFDGCTGLSAVYMPASLEVIEDYAFRNCTSLNLLYAKSEKAPSIAQNTFEGVNSGCQLYIHKNAIGYDEW